MIDQIRSACGFLFIFSPPAFLLLGFYLRVPWIAFCCLFFLFPLLRFVFGNEKTPPPLWSELFATILDLLPAIFYFYFTITLVATLWFINNQPYLLIDWIGAGLSIWSVFLFASSAAHELLHKRSSKARFIGNLLAGMIAYPALGVEHRVHHGNFVDNKTPETADINESVWAFSMRRALYIFGLQLDGTSYKENTTLTANSLLVASMATVVTWIFFVIAAGFSGFVIYGLMIVSVNWGIQAITYIQHWGLGSEDIRNGVDVQPAWEDGCRLQQWLTLGISYHQTHHQRPQVPYYRLTQTPGSPRLPAGYVVLLLCSLFPPLWRRIMLPVLNTWKAGLSNDIAMERRSGCFSLSKQQRSL